MVTASLKNYRQSPRKVRRVADLIRGKTVNEALNILSFASKRAGNPLKKLLLSAIANAERENMSKDSLAVSEIRVDKGVILKRMMPLARGRGFPIHKHSSHVKLVLETAKPKVKKVKASVKPATK